MKTLPRIALCLILAALPLAARHQAAPQEPRQDQAARSHPERTNRGLSLTEAQKTSIKAIRDRHHPDLVLRRDAVRQTHLALQAALRDAATSEAQLRTLHDKAAAARFDLLLARRAMRQEVQALLSPEQRAKAAERRALVRVRREERMRHLRMAAGMAR